MARWVSKANWARAKGSVSQQLQEKAGPRVRLGGQVVKRGARLGVAKARAWRRPGSAVKQRGSNRGSR
jgi:hypothetical protein